MNRPEVTASLFRSGSRLSPLVWRLLLVGGILIDSLIVLTFAVNLQLLWAILLISTGIIIGLFTIRGNGAIAGLICSLALVAVPLIVALREMPVHSFEWQDLDGLDRIAIELPGSTEKLEFTERVTLSEFRRLVRLGSYQTGLKCGECYGITLFRGPNSARYVIRYDAFGRRGGDSIETIFVPKDGHEFRKWLEDVVGSRVYTPSFVAPEQ
jgi:hypothetical protein